MNDMASFEHVWVAAASEFHLDYFKNRDEIMRFYQAKPADDAPQCVGVCDLSCFLWVRAR